jgi:hypothetical protein
MREIRFVAYVHLRNRWIAKDTPSFIQPWSHGYSATTLECEGVTPGDEKVRRATVIAESADKKSDCCKIRCRIGRPATSTSTPLHRWELAGLADSFVQPSIVSFVVVPSVLRIVVADLPLLNPVLGFLNLRHGHLFS